jgi:uncharacterized protein
MYLQRFLQLDELIAKKSHFLFGPRSTGKTSMIKAQLGDKAIIIDLLRTDMYLLLQSKPWEIENIIAAQALNAHIVVIDEIQKVPSLLDEVHRLIEEKNITFLLTGSSARKLKKSGVNLLAGRAWRADLMPLTWQEIKQFNLDKYLLYGGLPQVVTSEAPEEELEAYVNIYLKEEIQAEALVRKLQSFSKFLRTAALTSGTMLNFAKISNDIAVPASTVREYYQILEDTLVGFLVPAWVKTAKRKPISTAKFYFFDIGARNAISGINTLPKNSDIYGQAFEHFMVMELRAYISYTRKKLILSYWRSVQKHEVDFILGDDVAIEIKCTDRASSKHLKGLKALQEEKVCQKYYLVCFDRIHRIDDNVEIIHWEAFLEKLWGGEVI